MCNCNFYLSGKSCSVLNVCKKLRGSRSHHVMFCDSNDVYYWPTDPFARSLDKSVHECRCTCRYRPVFKLCVKARENIDHQLKYCDTDCVYIFDSKPSNDVYYLSYLSLSKMGNNSFSFLHLPFDDEVLINMNKLI